MKNRQSPDLRSPEVGISDFGISTVKLVWICKDYRASEIN